MADISTELARILSAIYGEDVRGSIHDAIEKINDVSEVVLTTGTAVTSPSSSSTGFYDDSLYLNTDTFELWKCTGVNTWASQGTLKGEAGDDGNGIVSIEKTSTSGLVDTYTITYTNGTTSTFNVTNGEDGTDGNKWYRGTGISGKAALPTVYTGSGVADANSGDMFLNPSEGAVYSCVTGGIPTVATWQYEMTLSGGGGGTSDYPDLTNKPQINGHILLGNQTGADLGLANSSDIPTVDQTYSATSSNAQSGKAVAEALANIPSGGMLPYLYIDSEAGATVTVNQPDGTTITPTAAGSGHWECELTGGYGTYVVHSYLSGQGDQPANVVVDIVKEYHVTDTHYDHTVSFVAPSGSTVRIEGGTETYTLTGTGSTQTQAVHSASTSFTVTATMDGNGKPYTFTTPSTTGQTTTIPSGTFDFGTINVSVAADFVTAGSTITCVNGGTSCTPKTAASTLVFRVPTTGTWTISGEISGTTYTTTATVSSLSTAVTANLQTVPDGSTVLPTDDIQTWLNCAGIYDKTSYTTLADVLGDATTLLALMSDNNAVDYLVRSTTWATDVCADSTAMTDIGANNYAADTLLNNATWRNSICNSANFEIVLNQKVPTLTGSSTAVIASGSFAATSDPWYAFDNNTSTQWVSGTKSTQGDPWCGYHFAKKIKVNKVHLMNHDGYYLATGKIQGSNDGTNWTDIADITGEATALKTFDYNVANNNYYSYYRIYANTMFDASSMCAFRIIQFYGREEV